MLKRYILLLSFAISATAQAGTIKHRFIAVDESRSQLHYVDQFDPSNDWTIQFPTNYRDVQLVGNSIIVSARRGYEEYDLASRTKIKSVTVPRFGKTETLNRLPNGHTIIGCNISKDKGGGVRFVELDGDDDLVQEVVFPELHHLRLARLSTDGALLFGCDNRFISARWDGTYEAFATAEEKRHIYEVAELTNGNYRVSCGYGTVLEEWTPDGKFVRTICGGKAPDGFYFHFFGRAQLLKDSHWVVANWTGHGKDDSQKGVQLIEFDKEGNIVWSWHDPERSGSVNGAIIIE
jgi:hypothetical protein